MRGTGFLLAGLLVLFGCEGNQNKISCKDSPLINYANFGKSFVNHHCQTCHASSLIVPGDPIATAEQRRNAPTEFIYDCVEQVWRDKELILISSLGEDPIMPPAGGVFEDDRKRLEIWLTCGQEGGIDGVDLSTLDLSSNEICP